MKRIRLTLEDLRVDSSATTPGGDGKGTVFGREDESTNGTYTCVGWTQCGSCPPECSRLCW